jgi:molybdopterin synthase catalytic subunit
MANPVYEVLLTKERLQAPKQVIDFATGAIVDFWGVVRELEDEREIEGIKYEAHWAMAEHQLNKIVERAISDFVLKLVVLHHRVGFVGAGESSLFVRVAGQHRSEAFNASQSIVEELKKRVPIWKHPKFKIDNRSAEKDRHASEIASTALRI